MNEVSLRVPDLFYGEEAPYFSYNKEQPTYYTEYLSFYLLSVFADLGFGGFRFFVETKTPAEQQASIDSFVAEFSAWLDDCEQKVSAWLVEDDASRGLPALLMPPQISLPLAGSILLFKPALVSLAVDSVSSVIRVIQTATANRRQAQIVRLLNKAFFRESFWGLSNESIPLKILDALEIIAKACKGKNQEGVEKGFAALLYDSLTALEIIAKACKGENQKGVEKGFAALLYDSLTALIDIPDSPLKEWVNIPIMLKKILDSKDIIRLLSHTVITSGGNIEETEFTLAGTDIR